MIFLRSLAFALIFYGATVPIVLSALVAAWVSRPALVSIARTWARFHRWCARVLLRQHVRIEGTIPPGAGFFVLKHESMFETIELLLLFDQPVPVLKKELTDIPLWGAVAKRHGVIALERSAGGSAMRTLLKRARGALERGAPICLFPEGTRVPHGEAPPIKSGFAGLYKLLGLPVVPIAVDSGRVSPRGSFLKRPGLVTYKVGAPIPPGLPRAEAEARVHAAINALNG